MMRHEHTELIREEMKSTHKYCHDIATLSIADIWALIDYNEKIIEKGGDYALNDSAHINYRTNLKELREYMYEFNLRLANRTPSFDKDYYKKNKLIK